MTVERLLLELSARAVQVRRSGNDLSIRSNAEVDAALVARLSGHKSALLELLDDGGDWWCPPPVITPEMLPLVDLTRAEIDSIVSAVPGAAANVQDIYPLAPLQEGILFHHLLGGDGDPYLLSCSFRFDSRARLDAYLAALQAVVDRHDILRTAFVWEMLKSPVQVVWRRAPLPIEELAAMNAGELCGRFDPRRHRIDVRTAPLLRAHVARDAADGRWMLLLLSHHLVSDHTTLEILQSEVRAHLEGRADELPAPLPFRNFVAHVRLGASVAEHEEFFRAMLGDVDEPTAPFGLVQAQGDGSDVEEEHLDLDDDVSTRLRAHARRLGVTPASLFHLAWALVLARASSRDDVVFGTVLFGRMNSGEGADRVLGLFMNTLPLRVRVGEDDVETSVRRTHAAVAELLGHEHASLALAQRCSGVPAPAPLFSALLNYRHNARAVAEPRGESLGMESAYGQERTNFPLVLSVDDLGDGFALTAQVQAPVGAARVCELVRTAVERLLGALESSSASLRTIDVLPEAERRQLLDGWNDTRADVPEVCIHELFEAQVERTPNAIAVVDERRALTYRALNEEANQLAHALRADGVVPDARVAVRMERSVEMVVALLAVLKAGGAYVPLDPSYPEERLQQMLTDAEAVVVLDGRRTTSPRPTTNPPRVFTPRNLAYVIYTSGSTGVPKGVMNEHRGVVNRLLWMQQAYRLTANDAVLQKTPYSFDVSVWELFWTLSTGARLVMARPEGHKDPRYLGDVIARERITTLHFVPSMLQTFLQHGDLAKCTSLQRVVCSGEALPAALVARFHELLPHVALSNLYGPTEAAVDVTAWECQRGDVRASTPIGRPIANTRVYILDSHGQPVPIGVAGELHIGGVQVARGYLNRPQLTSEKFVRDPFSEEADARMYRTGDLARWQSDGAIEFLGRNDFQVKLRGFRIELGEIEARLIEQSLVREAVVLAHEQRLVAYIVAPQEIDIDELRRDLSTKLPEHMVPAAYVRLDALPLTSNGKLDRKALPAPDGDAYGARAYEPPRGEVETLIARIWSELLGLERVGRHDNFFQLGGHSLLAVSLMERMRRESLAVDVRAVFNTPTLAGLAAASCSGRAVIDVPPNAIPDNCDAITPAMLPLVVLTQDEIDTIVRRIPGGAGHVQDIYPLAPLQEGILFHHLLEKEGDPYLLVSAMRTDSRPRLDAYLAALQSVIDRHDILRTSIAWEGLSRPVQVVHRRARLPVEEVQVDAPDVASALIDRFHPRHHRIDVAEAPLLRAYIAKEQGSEHWVVLLLLHHLAGDHTTLEIVQQEIEAHLLDRAATLPPPLPFRNFIAQARLGVTDVEHEEFFRAMLADVEETTAPFGLVEVRGDGSRIAEAHLVFDASWTGRLRTAARRLGVSTASLCHLAYAQVLARVSGRDDVVFGTVLFGRMQVGGTERVLGLTINTLPLRITIGDGGVETLARHTHERLAELLRHEHASLALAQRCSGVAASAPLFSALLNYRHIAGETPTVDAVDAWQGIDSLYGEERTNYPLLFSVDHLENMLGLTAQIDASIDPMRICRFMREALRGLVIALERAPETLVRDVEVLPLEERRLLLDEWNETSTSFPAHLCLHELFEASARSTPDAIAVAYGADTLTYRELNARANRLAHRLCAHGVGPDERAAICMPRGVELVVAMLAVLKAGGAYVPLDPAYPEERLGAMLGDSAPRVVLMPHASRAIEVADGIARLDPADETEWPSTNVCSGVRAEDLAYLLYTSGSTGRPKGVMIEHRQAVNFVTWARSVFAYDVLQQTLFSTSLNFDLAVFECFVPLSIGATVRIVDDALALAQTRTDVTLINTVPSAMRALLDAGGVPPSVRHVNLAGEPLQASLAERIFAGTHVDAISNLYGPSETTTYSTWVTMQRGQKLAPHIGRPIANTRVYLLDAHRRPVPFGAIGEIHIGGAGVARGYWNRPELTAERFLHDPFASDPKARMYRTGDLGRHRPDGTLELLGRNDFQVKIRGFRIELGEIEARLLAHEHVSEALVLAREEANGGKRLVAYVVPCGQTLDAETLRVWLRAQLPEHMIPAAYVTLRALPLTPNGKIDRQALPAPEDDAFGTREFVPPRQGVESTLAEIWAALLAVDRVGRHDNFFELGGHSLLAVTLMERMRQAGLPADVRSVFTTPTLAGLAAASADSDPLHVPPSAIPEECDAITPAMLPLVALTSVELERIVSRVPGGARNVQDIYPLAPLQEGILFHHVLAKEGDPYLLISALRFDSRARLDTWLAALQSVIDRHDVLRTAVLWEELSTPVQVVLRRARLSVEEIEIGVPDRIDVRQAPMLRAYIARDGDRWLLTLLLHHLAGDHATLELVHDEIEAHLLGRTDELPAPLPFRNFVAQARLGVREEEHEEFFRRMLGDVDEPTAPFGLIDVQSDGATIVEAGLPVDVALGRRLRERARRLGVSAATICHVAWAQVLARVSGRDDVVFGTLLFGRMHGGAAADRVMGLFMNTLPIRIRVDETGAEDAVRRAHASLAELLRHEHAPLALAQRCSAIAAPAPLFSALLNYRHTAPASESADDAWQGIEGLHAQERTNYPLVLAVDDFGRDFALTAQCASVAPSRVCRLMHTALEQLVEALESTPNAPLSGLDVLDAREREELLYGWNATGAELPDACVHELFEAAAGRTPDAIAVAFRDGTLTYHELNARANQLAHHLRALGVGADARVAICIDRGLDMIVGLLGILKAGGAYVPLDPSYPAERIELVLADSEPLVILTGGEVPRMVAGVPLFDLERDAALWSHQPRTNVQAELRTHHLAYVIYTSGSSGRPKGVMNDHRGVVNLLWSMRNMLHAGPHDNVLALTTLSFDIAALELYLPLVCGARMTLLDRATSTNATALAQAIADARPTIVQATPATWRMLVDSGWSGARDLAALCGGEALPVELAKRIRSRVATLWNVYGPTETTIWSSAEQVADAFEGATVPIGRPLANTRIYILDARGRPAPGGVEGEIHIGGAGVARGYFQRPELTAEKFVPDPFALNSFTPEANARMFKTGDLGRFLGDGRVECLGRNDFQVKVRGYRIELGEIEARLVEHPGIREAAVVAREDAPGEKQLVAYVVGDAIPTRDELRRALGAHLPEYMIPTKFVRLDALPLTPNGKLHRAGLPAPDATSLAVDAYEPPRGESESLVAEVWSGVLRVDRVGRRDSFFALGGHSLLAVQAVSRFAQIGIDVTLDTLFSRPVLAEFARDLPAGGAPSLPPIAVASAGERLALSFEQQPLWLVSQLDGRGTAYHIRLSLRLGGILDGHALRRALDRLIARHEVLRTTYEARDGEPFVHVAPSETFALREHDPRESSEDAAHIAIEEAEGPFDLANGPLIRGRLVRVADDEHLLLITMHHIVSDGWSAGLVVQELSALYAAFHAGAPDPLPPLRLQYLDYVAWQRRRDALQEQEEYWTRTLAGAPALLELPSDRPRPARQDYAGASIPIVLDAELTRGLRGLSRRHGTTLFMTLMAGWAALLARLSGQPEVMIGTPTANRRRAELEGLIGFFVNTLALRIDVSGAPNVAELLDRVKAQLLAAQRNQDVPFERIVELSAVPRTAAYTPLFQVLFAWQSTSLGSGDFGNLTLLPAREESATAKVAAKFDLSLTLGDAGDVIEGSLDFATALFDGATIERYLSHWRTLLRALVRDDKRDDQTVDGLPLLDASERAGVLYEWNATDAPFPDAHCIHELFEVQAERMPDAIALVQGDVALTYAELNARANRLAHHLRGIGVEPDARVAIHAERGFGMIVAVLAVWKAGGAFVPLDPAYPQDRLQWMVADSAPVAILTGAASWDDGDAIVVDLDAAAWNARPSTNPVRRGLTPHHLAYLIYTSGSTGTPKGVMIEHRGLCNLATAQIAGFGVEPSSRVLQFASFSFDACVSEIAMALCRGAALVLPPPRVVVAGQTLVDAIDRFAITHVTLPPAVLAAMPDDASMPSLHTLIVAGDAPSEALVKRWGAGRRFINAYGPSETTVCATMRDCDVSAAGRPPIGRPIANTRVYVLDAAGEPVPIGVTGEIHIGGAGVGRGYFQRPELTAARFVHDPFAGVVADSPGARMYKSGDLGRLRADGTLDFLGRNDFQVKVRGFRIELGEIEASLRQCIGVREALVLAREDGAADKRLVAYIVCDALAVDAWCEQLSARLPDYLVPASYVRLDAFPLTPSGKLDRAALPVPEIERAAGSEAPRGVLEMGIAEVWREVLEREEIGRDEDFFEAGGDSLLAVRVVWRLRQTLGLEIPLNGLFDMPVLADFARELESLQSATLPAIPRAAESERGALSFAQQRLWFLAQLEPGNTAYHLPFSLRLRGPLDAAALRRALDRLVARHEVLRTTFVLRDGEPRQSIADASRFVLFEHDLRESDDVERELLSIASDEARAPFDLARGPLIRGRLVRVADDEHALLITQHHIVSDGWSMAVLLRELSTLYGAYAARESDPLPPLPLQYADYAAWQRRTIVGDALQRQAGHWRATLANAPALLDLPADRPRPARQNHSGGVIDCVLDEELTRDLRALGLRHGTTLFMTLLAAWASLMARLSGQDDLVIGTPAANRSRAEVEGLIGFFVNTLALRIDLSGSPTVGELLQRVKECALAAQQHQDIPFEQVVELAQPVRSLAHTPLFQVLFSWDNGTGDMPGFAGLELDRGPAPSHVTSKFDLTLWLGDAGNTITGGIEYATSLFDRATIARFLSHWRTLLRAMVDDDRQTIDRLPLLAEDQRQRLVDSWNDTRADFPADVCIHELFEAQVERTPDAIAVVDETRGLTYRALNEEANRLAHWLRGRGVVADARVAVRMERSADMVVALLAVLKAGGAYVPLDPSYPEERLQQMLADAEAVVVLDGSLDTSQFPPTNPSRDTTPRNLAYVIYTSGSTGVPKGVMNEHRGVVNRLLWMQQAYQLTANDVVLQKTPYSFDVSVWEFFWTLATGARLVMARPDGHKDPAYLSEVIARERITTLHFVPSMLRAFLQHGDLAKCTSLQRVVCSGEALPAALVARFHELLPHVALSNLYGPTEAAVDVTAWECRRSDVRASIPIGRPIANTRIYILDSHGEPVPVGVAGELHIGGVQVARGYLNRPELTNEKFVRDPFSSEPDARMYRTGDLARWLPEGVIEYLGRNDFQVKLRGFRIELGEIEARLVEHPRVREAVVLARDERLVAYLVAQDEVDVDELRAHLSAKLPEHMVPAAYVRMEAWPLTSSGKLDRKALPGPDGDAFGARTDEPPQGEVETLIAGIWSELLGLDRIGRHDNFFQLGGHSLLAVSLMERMRSAGLETDVSAVFTAPTPAGLAAASRQFEEIRL